MGAETVELRLPNGVVVSGEYARGDSELPAVLVLHGFLQTRHYLTVAGLISELQTHGATVLAPTLSLGVSRRKQSLACEAVHTHTLADDTAEIAAWVEWLVAQGHGRITLLGHSFGSLQLLVYAIGEPHPAVERLIATSLVDLGPAPHQPAALDEARRRLDRAVYAPAAYRLGFCERYVSPPDAYLSYAEWTRERILDALSRIRIPLTVIMGGNDRRMEADWPRLLEEHGVSVRIIPGANHFFSAEKEFALYDEVIPLLTAAETRQ